MDLTTLEPEVIQNTLTQSVFAALSGLKNKKVNIQPLCPEKDFENLAIKRFSITRERCQELKQKMQAFSDPYLEDSHTRWNQLIRILDGKATLRHIREHVKKLASKKDTKLWTESESYGFFKNWFNRKQFIPDEILEIIQRICKQADIRLPR